MRAGLVIMVAVSDEDGVDFPAAGVEHGLLVVRIFRAGIDHDPSGAGLDQPGIGAVIRHRAGVSGDNADKARRFGEGPAIFGDGFLITGQGLD
ncbi:hypothetical protein AOE01nite_15190 [Acetobacter oeni]|uniref:Uncharacterized protein n=1 Tax=Acetobacter oeni TaxID=304077 RepID=A0A511XK14_9PROT|nr:hypothetical protein AOE01nite_15190 [Acetobacter oeni]